MTRPRATTSQADQLGATIADNKARLSSVELLAHSHDQLARGIVGYSERTTTVQPIATSEVTLVSVTVNATPGRFYKITAACNLYKEGGNNWANAYIYEGSTQLQRIGRNVITAGQEFTYHGSTITTSGSGAVTFSLRVRFEGNTLNQAFAASDNPMFILVEDIGPRVVGLPRVFAYNAIEDTTATVGGVVYRIITWHADGALEVFGGGLDVEYVMVGGGGGGGHVRGGGGGAGGFLTNVGLPSPLTLANANYPVVVGAGGNGAPAGVSGTPTNGGNTTFGGLTAIGGGRGGAGNGASGGSGGGATGSSGATGGTGTLGQGFNGGSGTNFGAGGGGGASAVGGNGTASVAGNGGNGQTTTITGVSLTLGGGGGGGHQANLGGTRGLGGTGGGGNGGLNGTTVATSGAANTGGGGGGAGGDGVNFFAGGSGGSGIVVVRFPIANQA